MVAQHTGGKTARQPTPKQFAARPRKRGTSPAVEKTRYVSLLLFFVLGVGAVGGCESGAQSGASGVKLQQPTSTATRETAALSAAVPARTGGDAQKRCVVPRAEP